MDDRIYNIAAECGEMLDAIGMGQPGKPNTLWAKTKEACDEIARLRAEVGRLTTKLAHAEADGEQLAFYSEQTEKDLRAEVASLKAAGQLVIKILRQRHNDEAEYAAAGKTFSWADLAAALAELETLCGEK